MTGLFPYMIGLFSILIAVTFTVYRHREQLPQMGRTALAILFAWVAGIVYVSVTDNYTPWHFNIFIDALAATAVIYHPAGRVQGYIGLFYGMQIACHIGYGLHMLGFLGSEAPDPVLYYDVITWIAWAQLLAMGVWCGGVWIGGFVHRLRHRRTAGDSLASAATTRKAS